MKQNLFNIILTGLIAMVITPAYSQIPEGYYDTAEGLAGEELRGALYQIIKGHQEFPYSNSSTDTWDILKEADRDTVNAANVLQIYTGRSVNGDQEYNNGNGWNREHVWAKSRGDFGTAPGPGTDCHHLRPSDISTNADRGNFWFDNGGIAHFDEGQETGNYYSTAMHTWQPREAVKGDVARMLFYMDTRYEGESGEPDLELIDYLPTDDYTNDPVHARLGALLEWHKADPVDNFERNRNEVVYSYQGNRNPYIDHPEYVAYVWEGVDPGVGMDGKSAELKFRLWPNPAQGVLHVALDQVSDASLSILSLSGKRLMSHELTGGEISLDISGLEKGVYLVQVRSGQEVLVRKLVRN